MNNKTINFNCGQLIQLIGKTINFSEPLLHKGIRVEMDVFEVPVSPHGLSHRSPPHSWAV
jgi:hypothetical protein